MIFAIGLWALALSVYDVRSRIIPNYLTIGGAVVALAVRFWVGGMPLLADGFAAGVVAGAFLLLPFLMRGAGGGDVKMLFAAGTMTGWHGVLQLLWFTSLAGLVLAVGMLACKRADGARLKHYGRCLVDWRYDRKAGAAVLPPRESNQVRIPFSVAIAAGMLTAMIR